MFKIMIKGGLAWCVQQRLSSKGVGRPEDKWQWRSIILPGWLPMTIKIITKLTKCWWPPVITNFPHNVIWWLFDPRQQWQHWWKHGIRWNWKRNFSFNNMSSWVMMVKKHEFMSSWVIMVTRAYSYIGGSTGGSSTTISGSTPMSVPSTSASGAAYEPSVLLRLLNFPFPQCVHTNLFSTHAHNIFDISTFIHQQSENESEDDQFGILKTEKKLLWMVKVLLCGETHQSRKKYPREHTHWCGMKWYALVWPKS